MNNYEEEITELKNKIAEYEAVEQYIMKTIRNGGEYDDILKAHYREGKVVDGEWVDDKEEEVCDLCKCLECCCLTDKIEQLTDELEGHRLAIIGKANKDMLLSDEQIEQVEKEIEKTKDLLRLKK